MMIHRYPFGAVESSPAISSHRVAKSAEGVAYYGLSEEEGKTFIAMFVLADSMMKLKQVEGGEHVGYGEKSPFVGVEIVKEGGMPTDLGALAEASLNEGVGILIEQLGEKSFRIYKTRNVLLAGEVTSRVPNAAVAIEPAKGWVKPEFWNKNRVTIAVAVAGLSVVAIGGLYLATRKKPMRANAHPCYEDDAYIQAKKHEAIAKDTSTIGTRRLQEYEEAAFWYAEAAERCAVIWGSASISQKMENKHAEMWRGHEALTDRLSKMQPNAKANPPRGPEYSIRYHAKEARSWTVPACKSLKEARRLAKIGVYRSGGQVDVVRFVRELPEWPWAEHVVVESYRP